MGKLLKWMVLCLLPCSVAAFVLPAIAQEKYPSRPITLVIGYGAGGTSDVSSRALVNAASKILGQPFVAVNKPGGASAVAMAGLKNERPDGYTMPCCWF